MWFTLGERQIKTTKNKEIISRSGKWVELDIMLNEISQIQTSVTSFLTYTEGRQNRSKNIPQNIPRDMKAEGGSIWEGNQWEEEGRPENDRGMDMFRTLPIYVKLIVSYN